MQSGDKSRVFINTIIITASTVVEKVIFFLVNILIARYLDINQYGEYTTALAFASFFSMFTDMGINETLIREINYEKEKEQTLFNVVLLKITLSIVVFALFIGVTFTTDYSIEVILLIVIFGFVRFGDEYLRLYYTYYDGSDNYTISAIYRLFFALSFLASVLAVIVIGGGNIEIALFRFIVVFVFLMLLTYKISRMRLLRFDIEYIKGFAGKTLPFASAFIYGNIISQGSLIILPLLHGTFYSGIFQNAYIFIVTLSFIPISFGRVFTSYLYRKKDRDADVFQFAFDIMTRSFVLLSFFIASLLFLYSDFIIVGVFGAKYSDSIGTLKILSLCIPFLFNAASIMLTSLDKQKLYSVILRYVAIINVMANIVLGYFYKDEGIAAATVLTFFLIFILSNILIKNSSELKICNSMIYYLKGGIIFLTCWLAYGYSPVQNPVVSMLLFFMLFGLLSLLLLFKKDDLRIAREILGR